MANAVQLLVMENETAAEHGSAGGDPGDFLRIYDEHGGRIYALCLRMLADPDLAKELTQQVVIRAWKTLSGFRGESPFSAWLHRLTVNVILDFIRSRRRLSERVEFTDHIEEYDCDDASGEPELRLDLEAAIASLPTQARLVLVLHDIEGYHHEEVAQQLGIAAGTSKAQLHRARKLLKERIFR